MSNCCLPARQATAADTWDGKVDTAHGSTGDEYPLRISFPLAKTFVGTDEPVIREDGEGPRRSVRFHGYELESVAVTNQRFSRFVEATGYRTEAEHFGWSAVFHLLLPNADAFPVSAENTPWWLRVDGAYWKAPEGPGSSIADRLDHPVVHVSWSDARAFADWCGGRLPTEAEWEHAARGGLHDPRFPWGDAEPDDSTIYCNIWQGVFPHRNTLADGYLGTSPVAAFAANGVGLYGMAGNVWEWTGDPFRIRSVGKGARLRNSAASVERHKVLKGGSFLCHNSYCYRYRIVARSGLPPDSAASNAGFRIAYDLA